MTKSEIRETWNALEFTTIENLDRDTYVSLCEQAEIDAYPLHNGQESDVWGRWNFRAAAGEKWERLIHQARAWGFFAARANEPTVAVEEPKTDQPVPGSTAYCEHCNKFVFQSTLMNSSISGRVCPKCYDELESKI